MCYCTRLQIQVQVRLASLALPMHSFDITCIHLSSLNNTQAEVNFVTAFVPSDTACLASSPGKIRRTADKIACQYKGLNLTNKQINIVLPAV